MRPNNYKVGAQKRKLGMGAGSFEPGTMFEAARETKIKNIESIPTDVKKVVGILGLI